MLKGEVFAERCLLDFGDDLGFKCGINDLSRAQGKGLFLSQHQESTGHGRGFHSVGFNGAGGGAGIGSNGGGPQYHAKEFKSFGFDDH